jgi:hypothetical protein
LLDFSYDSLSSSEKVSHNSIGTFEVHLERLIHLLEIIAVVGRPISATEAQIASGLPKPTCYRLMQTLQEQGLIEEPNNDGRYVIGERLIRIALLGKSDVDVRRVAAPLLKVAATKFNETVFLARFRDSKVEIIHVETPDDPARAFIHPGLGERPMHACSCSKGNRSLHRTKLSRQNFARKSPSLYRPHKDDARRPACRVRYHPKARFCRLRSRD